MANPPPEVAPQDARKTRRWIWICIALGVAALGVTLWQLLLQRAAAEIRAALGPEVTVEAIDIHWNGVELDKLTLAAPAGWPARHAARVAHIRVVPQWLSLVSGSMRLSLVEVSGAELSLWKPPEGRWRVLPAWTERPGAASRNSTGSRATDRQLSIAKLVIDDAALTLFDGQVSRPAHHMVIQDINATVRDLRLGGEPAPVTLEGTARMGPRGRARVAGRFTPVTMDSGLDIAVQQVPLAMVEPYLLKAAEAGVKRGDFDLQMRLNLSGKILDAPGSVVVHDLELRPASASSTFMGLPREALVERLKDRQGRIEIPFRLQGRIDDPTFSLGGAFKARLALAAADVLGLQQLLGDLAQRSGVSAQVERAAEKLKEWLRR